MQKNKKILVLGDIHFPFHNKKALDKVYAAIKKEQPDYVIQIGDLADQYNYSKYTKKPSKMTGKEELKLFREHAEAFWSKIQSLSKKSKCYQLIGNHDERLSKRVLEKLPEASHIVSSFIKKYYAFPGVTTMPSERAELQLEGIMFIHGYLSQLGAHSKKNIAKVVCGHSHVGGVVYYKHGSKILWELNVGFLADEKAAPMQYGQQSMKAWTLGYGLLTQVNGIWQPQFIPLQ